MRTITKALVEIGIIWLGIAFGMYWGATHPEVWPPNRADPTADQIERESQPGWSENDGPDDGEED